MMDPAHVRDVPESWKVVSSTERFSGRVISVRTDAVLMPQGDAVDRDYVVHPGSVGVLALDEKERVLLLRQYRHPARQMLWELAAGIRDVPGEPLSDTAARELAEETGYQARRWDTLIDTFTSPGMSGERVRVFLARDLQEADINFERVHEETDMPLAWVPLREAVDKVIGGHIRNSMAVMGILAAYAASLDGFATLRPAGAPEA